METKDGFQNLIGMLYIVTARLAYIVFSGSKFQAYILFFLMFHWSSKKLYSILWSIDHRYNQ